MERNEIRKLASETQARLDRLAKKIIEKNEGFEAYICSTRYYASESENRLKTLSFAVQREGISDSIVFKFLSINDESTAKDIEKAFASIEQQLIENQINH